MDKDKLDKFPEISELPHFPECGKQGTCIDRGGINIEDGINIDVDNVDVDWDDIQWDDIDWDNIDVDIDDDIDVDIDDDIDVDIDDEDVDIVVREMMMMMMKIIHISIIMDIPKKRIKNQM